MATLIKNLFYHMLWRLGIFSLARRLHKNQALILTYHGVLSKASDNYVNRNCVSAEMFDRQVRWLKNHYSVISLSELVDAIRGEKPLPPYAAAITFDDGFLNNYSVALPILMKHNVPATMFLTTGYIGGNGAKLWTERVDSIIYSSTLPRLKVQMNGQPVEFDVSSQKAREQASDRIRSYLKSQNPEEREKQIIALERQIEHERDFIDEMEERYKFMSWEDAKVLAESGMELGSHTVSHAILSTLATDKLKEELRDSKITIEEKLQRECPLFSYPNGTTRDFTQRDQDMLKKLGYRAAFSQVYGFNSVGDNPYALKRINIARSENFAYFLAKITGVWGLIKNLPGMK